MEDIIAQYLKPIYNFALRLTGDKDLAEDIAQEVFVKVWKNRDGFDETKNFKIWIFTIARNTAFDFLRKKKNISFSSLDSQTGENEKSFAENLPDLLPLPDEIFVRKELALELENALSKIRPDFREIIFLHYTQNLSFAEIAEVVGKPLNTVKSQHLRALHQIRSLIRI